MVLHVVHIAVVDKVGEPKGNPILCQHRLFIFLFAYLLLQVSLLGIEVKESLSDVLSINALLYKSQEIAYGGLYAL